MCSGAIIQSRIKNLYFGAFDPKTGASGSVLNLFDYPFNHKVNVAGGIMEEECSRIIKDFFKELRQKNVDNHQ
jgi:tRNA(adenine34) deaminase